MAGVHATGGFVLLAGSAAFVVLALICTRVPGWSRALGIVGNVLVGLLAAQIILGGFLYVQGRRPAEPLHYLYAVVALAAIPAARSLALDAPARSRAGVMAVAGIVVAALVWRLFATGDAA